MNRSSLSNRNNIAIVCVIVLFILIWLLVHQEKQDHEFHYDPPEPLPWGAWDIARATSR